jgi:DNA-binding NtrC family response regulator
MPKKILVADDDKAMLNLYSRVFSQTEYSISPALSFEEAARLLREESYDLLITDFMFPDGVGTDLIRLFSEASAGGKSLMVTGSACAKDRPDCGCEYDYMEKPFRVEELLTAVKKALG